LKNFFSRGFSWGLEGLFPTKGQDSNCLDSAVSHKLYPVNISPTERKCEKVKGGGKDEGVKTVESDEIKVTMDH